VTSAHGAKQSVRKGKRVQPSDSGSGEAALGHNEGHNGSLKRSLVWVGVGLSVAGLGAAVAFAIARSVLGARRLPDDPTSVRIQQLIDEANTLLKTLDEQRGD
jgi:hypothetical protein